MQCQYYSVVAAEPDRTMPGQFVFPDDDSNTAVGFIYEVNDDEIEIVLFEPVDIMTIPGACYIDARVEWTEMLYEALRRSTPEIQAAWVEAIGEHTKH